MRTESPSLPDSRGHFLARLLRFCLWVYFGLFTLVFLRVCATLAGEGRVLLSLLLALIALVLAAAAALLLGRAARRGVLAARRSRVRYYLILGVCFFLLQCLLGFLLRCPPTRIYADLRYMHENALSLLDGGRPEIDYFGKYPHQMPLLYLFTGYYALVRAVLGRVPLYAGLPLNLLLIDLGIFFLILLARRIWNERRAALVLAVCVLFAPFYTYVPFFYIDTISMPLLTAPLYLYARAVQSQGREQTVCYILCGALFALGAILHATILIPLVAVCIHLLVRHARALRRLLRPALCVLLSFLALYGGWKVVDHATSPLTEAELDQYRYPKMHWVMMSFEGPMYDKALSQFTAKAGNYAQKQAAATQRFLAKLQERGALGTLDYLWYKASFQWGDGTYRSGVYLARSPAEPADTLLHRLTLNKGDLHFLFRGYCQVYLCTALLLMLVSLFAHLRRRSFSLVTVLHVTLMGQFLFFLVWEANPKYLLTFMLVLLMLSADGLCIAARWLRRRAERRRAAALPGAGTGS